MPRINIEDSLFKDQRWIKLILKTGCEHKALGLICNAWILAQQNWLKYKSIPAKAWVKDFDVLVECELASVRADGSVYIKGSKRAFTWLEQKSTAGKKASEKKVKSLEKARSARWNKNDLNLNGLRTALNGSERTQNGSEPLSPTLSLSLSPTPILSQTHSQSQTHTQDYNTLTNGQVLKSAKSNKRKTEDIEKEKENKESNKKIWDAYFNAYRMRYGVEPIRNATINSQVKQLRERLGTLEAVKVVEFYLTHNDSFFLKNTHSLGLCLKQAESLRTQMLRGKPITSTIIKSFEKTQTTQELFDRIDKDGI